jgi:hypothetical protein
VSKKIEKEYIAREPTLEKYLALVRRMENHFKEFMVPYIEHSKNTKVDDLEKATARNTLMPADVFLKVIEDSSIKIVLPEPRLINIIEGEDWRT